MEFAEYLKGKKIDEQAFAKSDPDQYQEFKLLFAQLHPESLTAQKLFLINQIRRRYPLSVVAAEDVRPKPKPAKPKVGIRPKPAAKPVMKKPENTTDETGETEKPKPAKAKPKVKPIIRKK